MLNLHNSNICITHAHKVNFQISKFSVVILNENRWSTNCTPTLVGTKLVEVFLHLGLNQVQGLILGLVFQVGG